MRHTSQASNFVLLSIGFLAICATAGPANAGLFELGSAHDDVAGTFSALSASIAEFQTIPCLTDEALSHLDKLQSSTTAAQKSFETTYKEYVQTVSKPMPGTGKCDGGFHSVAEESEHRRKTTSELGRKIKSIRGLFSNGINSNFNDPNIDMNDNSAKQDCYEAGTKLYDILEHNGLEVDQALKGFAAAAMMTEAHFRVYTAKNSKLSDDCGSLPEGLTSIVGSLATAPVPEGAAINPSSTITGKIKRPTLDDPTAGNSIRGPLREILKANAESAVSESESSTITSASRGERTASPASTRRDKEAILDNVGGKMAGGSSTENPTKSEEMAVQAMLDRKNSNARSSNSNQNASALELMVSAQDHSNEAAKKAGAEVSGTAIDSNLPGTASESIDKGNSGSINTSSHSSPLVLGSPDQALFERMHLILRQQKRELEKRKRVPQDR